jgi:DNA polymerase-3 subunit epsilon
MSTHHREIILDTETTGLDPKKGHKIIEIGCIELINRVKTGRSFHAYIDPQMEVPDEAFRIHGISTEFLKGKPLFSHIVTDFIDFIDGATLVIHNAPFDVKFINHEFNLLKHPPIVPHLVIDTLIMARKKFPGSPVSLDALCKRFNIDLSARTKHGALLDAELLCDVYIELTGGNQTILDFNTAKISTDPNNQKEILSIERPYKEPRKYLVNEDELIAHTDFLNKIKKPIWTS